MKLFWALLSASVAVVAAGNEVDRDQKVLPLFAVVSFENKACVVKSDSSMSGTCLTSSECTSKGGSADGGCGAGFGVCCMFTLNTCGTEVSQNCTYVTNPNYPSTESNSDSCTFSVRPCTDNICQIRLDFDNLVLPTSDLKTNPLDPTKSYTDCDNGVFAVKSPSGNEHAPICGTSTGQHMYVHTGRTSSTTALSFGGGNGGTKSWKVKVTQIECNNPNRAREGCDKWYTGPTGEMYSYGYATETFHIGRQTSMCVRTEAGYCTIQYAQYPGDSPDSFVLDDPTQTDENNAACAEEWLAIPTGLSSLAMYFCGQKLATDAGTENGDAIPQITTPFNIAHVAPVATSATTHATALQTGFHITYTQNPC